MAKNKKNHQQAKPSNSNSPNPPQAKLNPPPDITQPQTTLNSSSTPTITNMVQPEQLSLKAQNHIQTYLGNRLLLDKNELNAILRLSQHLRVFGLLSAAGYINQSNEQEGEVRQRTVPVWGKLLGLLINETAPPNQRKLMEEIQNLARNNPTEYMVKWRQSLILSQYWNFWGRAYTDNQ
jgi:hypothetical protein